MGEEGGRVQLRTGSDWNFRPEEVVMMGTCEREICQAKFQCWPLTFGSLERSFSRIYSIMIIIRLRKLKFLKKMLIDKIPLGPPLVF